MSRRVWFLVVPLVALLVFAARSTLVQRSSPPAVVVPVSASDAVGGTVAAPDRTPPSSLTDRATDRPTWSGAGPVLAPDDEDVEPRARAITSPVFSRLPPSDKRWVLAQAHARLRGPEDPRLEQVVQELSEVRLFAVSEREEPLGPVAPSR
jgi:hypothetical protein